MEGDSQVRLCEMQMLAAMSFLCFPHLEMLMFFL